MLLEKNSSYQLKVVIFGMLVSCCSEVFYTSSNQLDQEDLPGRKQVHQIIVQLINHLDHIKIALELGGC